MFKIMVGFACLHILLHCLGTIYGSDGHANLLSEDCGEGKVVPKIIGGISTDPQEFPWTVWISTGVNSCGGSLINKKYVLTAAHCIEDKSQEFSSTHFTLPETIIVTLGAYDISTMKVDLVTMQDSDIANPEILPEPLHVTVERVIVHEEYNGKNYKLPQDIALLRLTDDVHFNGYIAPICLPLSPELKNKSYAEATATVTGWGLTEKNTTTTLKQKVEVPVKSNEDCMRALDQAVDGSLICAGGVKGQDACLGDSGGPLMWLDNSKPEERSKWYLIGVVSSALEVNFDNTTEESLRACGNKGIPTLYTRITSYIDWIKDNMET